MSTTHKYLVEFIRHEKRTDPSAWVDSATAQRITTVVRQHGMDRLKPLFDALGGTISYDQIRIVAECLRNAARIASPGNTASTSIPQETLGAKPQR